MPSSPTGSTDQPTECDSNFIVRMLASMIAVAHEPVRFTDAELDLVFACWNEFLTTAPDLHQQRPEFFMFHQALLAERDFRSGQAGCEAA